MAHSAYQMGIGRLAVPSALAELALPADGFTLQTVEMGDLTYAEPSRLQMIWRGLRRS